MYFIHSHASGGGGSFVAVNTANGLRMTRAQLDTTERPDGIALFDTYEAAEAASSTLFGLLEISKARPYWK